MELKDTVELMNSEDYIDRFKAEYFQTKIRFGKLEKMLTKMDAGSLDFAPKCSKVVFLQQKRHMSDYIHDLEVRAEIEGISLE